MTRISPAFAVANWLTTHCVVGRPDRDALAAFEAECQEPRGKIVDSLLQLPPAPPDLLMTHDQGIALGVPFGDLVEIFGSIEFGVGRREG